MNDNMMEAKSGLDFSSFFVWKKLLSYRYADQNNYQFTKNKLNVSFNSQKNYNSYIYYRTPRSKRQSTDFKDSSLEGNEFEEDEYYDEEEE